MWHKAGALMALDLFGVIAKLCERTRSHSAVSRMITASNTPPKLYQLQELAALPTNASDYGKQQTAYMRASSVTVSCASL